MRVGVIGMGVMGENHLRVYKKLGVKVVGICDIKYDEEKGIENKYCFNDYKKLIKLKPDIISIAVPTKLHRKIAISCINAGINVLIEKPMAPTVKDCDRIINFAKKKNVKVMVGHIEQFNPAIIELKKHLQSIGKIYKISAKRVGPFHPRIRDTGVVIDLAIHDIDIMFSLMGIPVERCSVSTKVITENEDMFNAIIQFKNGVIGTIETDWVSPKKIRTLKITGKLGLFQLDYLNKTLSFIYKDGTGFDFDIRRIEPLEIELSNFIRAVKYNFKPFVTGEQGAEAVHWAEKFVKG
jgi:UDP-N-acetylglucosamine 3-dehydrogenase